MERLEATHGEEMIMSNNADELYDLFGSFRAEWLRDDIFKFFSKPAYFAHLHGDKSCVLMGGRGSGKTTVLRCLSYEGQDALREYNSDSPSYVGIYHKVNTNIVTAFEGPELNKKEWQQLFGHFFNLTICSEMAKYAVWYANNFKMFDISNLSLKEISTTLGFEKAKSLLDLSEKISESISNLEIYINNIRGDKPTISQLQSPITKFLKILKEIPGHSNTSFYIILDEYENLLDFQQRIVNTLIKHSEDNCYFKIGVRELGWREDKTLNESELLISPADYELIHIEERIDVEFSNFAKTVCKNRLESKVEAIGSILDLDSLLPDMTTLDESIELGVRKRSSEIRDKIKKNRGVDITVNSQHDYILYVFYTLNGGSIDKTISDVRDYANRKKSVMGKYHNYSHALLFSIADKKSKITKYYCGHKTFARISNKNIRFYMQLVHESIIQQTISSKKTLRDPIDCGDQTIAAQRVGYNYLRALEGVTARGAHLSKLVLGFGRFFQLLAADPVGKSPECNQFYLKESKNIMSKERNEAKSNEVASILRDAIMHLAFIRSLGTKPEVASDIREWDYALHPIFSPFFVFSSRKKRKTPVTDDQLLDMLRNHKITINSLLGLNQHLADTDLPPQMRMFNEFFQ